MAKQVKARSVSPRKSAKLRPPARRAKSRRRRPSILLMMALAALIAGFLFRRMMLPKAAHYLAYRPPDHPMPADTIAPSDQAAAGQRSISGPSANVSANAENLTEGDRRELGAVVRSKTR